MAGPGTVDFSLIEPHKENILPLSTGRSARALVTALSGTPDEHQSERDAFETELLTASDLDDPLDVWTRYVHWTLNTYPAGNSSQSQLLPLLERATRAFLHDSHYRNDPRYVKFWVLYIQKFSDAPREHFAYLARNDIGQRLALFYEEFAAWLESVGRRGQAREVYQMGVENGARPRERLVRKFEEFLHRCEANPVTEDEPRSPALPAVRPALAAKALPFGGGPEGGAYPDPQAQTSAAPTGPKPKREKMAIFSDADNGAQPEPVLRPGTGGWDNIGTLEHRRKENIMEPTPWAGQVLKQQGGGGGKAIGGDKLAIFRDIDQPPHPPAAAALGAPAFPNARYIYPNPSNPSLEYSFEELRAMQRNLLNIDWAARRRQEAQFKPPQKQPNKRPSPNPVFRDDISTTPPRAQTIAIAAKLHSPSPGRGKLKKRSRMMQGGEPTMTLHTRAATDEIYELLNQPIDQPNRDLDADPQDEGDGESDFFDDDSTTNTDAGGRAGFGSDSDSDSGEEDGVSQEEEEEDEEDDAGSDWSGENKIKYEEETVGLTDDTFFRNFNATLAGEEDEDEGSDDAGNNLQTEEPDLPPATMQPLSRKLFGDENHSGGGSAGGRRPFMTPIVERTEVSLPPTTARRRAAEKAQVAKTPSRPRGGERERRKREFEKVLSSPFMEIVRGQGGSGGIGESTIGELGSGVGGSEEDSDFFLPPPRKLGMIKSPPQKVGSPGDGDKENAAASKKAGLKKPLAPSSSAAIPPKADIAHKGGPLITDTQLNPMTPEIHATILSKLTTPLSAYEGYYEYPLSMKSKAAEIRKSLKSPSAKASGGSSGGGFVEVVFPGKPGARGRPAMGHTKYVFTRQIGEGAFAPVYLVENIDIASAGKKEEDGNDEMEAQFADLALVTETRHLNRTFTEAIKIETDPPSAWEFYIMRQAHRRLGLTRASESILLAHECHVYPAEASFLILPYLSQGTVLDLVNLSNRDLSQQGKPSGGLDEILVMFLTVEILRTMEGLHAKGLIHGDLKADNCLIRFLPLDTGEEWEPRYRRDGGGGWKKKGITLIDFGRGVDMKVFPPNVQFVADWKPDDVVDCVEVREMRPWSYQIDYHGCAGIIHNILFGRYLEIVGEKGAGVGAGMGGKSWRVKEPFKRYWQGDLWARCFDVLLNPAKFVAEEESARLPVLKAIRGVREEMEGWLEGNSEKGVGLRNVIRRLEGVVRGRK
ncbi:Mad3/BUB1 homology region 1-domain-containing protein [Tirmania nivea]|nr:Mad3/BUB1 homology region 1-domain-containing protein [Tirmania nivea]